MSRVRGGLPAPGAGRSPLNPRGSGLAGCLGSRLAAGPVLVGHRHGAAGLLAAAGLEVVLLGHHDLAPEDAHHGAVLLVADRLDVDDAAVVLRGRLPLVEHGRLAVDRVAVEGRRDVAQRLDLEVGDGLARHVRHRHAEEQRVDVVPDDDVLPELRRPRGVVGVEVERVVVHRQQAEEVVVVLRDRLAGPVPVDRTDLELLVAASELHARSSSKVVTRPRWDERLPACRSGRHTPMVVCRVLAHASASLVAARSLASESTGAVLPDASGSGSAGRVAPAAGRGRTPWLLATSRLAKYVPSETPAASPRPSPKASRSVGTPTANPLPSGFVTICETPS